MTRHTVTVRADCQGTMYEVTVYINKRCRVKIYVREVRWYIYVAQGSGPCIRVAITTREVSAVTLSRLLKMFLYSS